MTTIDSLLRACEEDYTDTDRYLIVADLLEEDGQASLALAFRWCGENGKHPARHDYPGEYKRLNCWGWLRNQKDCFKPESMLTDEYLHYYLDRRNGGWVGGTFLEVMQALADVMQKVTNHPQPAPAP